MRYFVLLGIIALTGCGVPSNPENGPVVLQCDGRESTSAKDDVPTTETKFYRIDGPAGTLARWNDQTKLFDQASGTLSITPATIHFNYMANLGEFVGLTTIDFDRVRGGVNEEWTSTAGNVFQTVTFHGPCKPISDPKYVETKF